MTHCDLFCDGLYWELTSHEGITKAKKLSLLLYNKQHHLNIRKIDFMSTAKERIRGR